MPARTSSRFDAERRLVCSERGPASSWSPARLQGRGRSDPRPLTAKKLLLAFGAGLMLVSGLAILADGTADTSPNPARGTLLPSQASLPADVSDWIPRIAVAYDGGRSAGLNELVWQGAKRAGDVFEAELTGLDAKREDTDADREARLRRLADAKNSPIFVVGPTWARPLATVAPDYPDTWFGIVDDGTVSEPNVIGILFNEEQGAFLVGAAAALTSETGNVGFLGGDQVPFAQKLEAGFTAGARAADPEVTVQVASLSAGESATAGAAASAMFDAGADVVFAASVDTAGAVIEAAHDRGLWAIGTGTDHYLTSDPSVRGAVLTSMLKHADLATYAITMEVANSVPKDGNNVFGLSQDALGYSTSGGFVDPIKARLDAFAASIAAGEILVPMKPSSPPTR